jgi:hypothetical protein
MAHELRRAAVATVVVLMGLAGCGDSGGDSSSAEAPSATAGDSNASADGTDPDEADPSAPASSGNAASGSGSAPSGDLPSACTLLSTESVEAALAGIAAAAEPQKPNEISARCIWSEGQPHSLGLDVRAGSNAEDTFNNTIVGGFTQVDFGPAEGWIMLGARESARDYRLVIFEAYDGTYYIHLSLQGPDRDDAAATQVATTLASEVYASLG